MEAAHLGGREACAGQHHQRVRLVSVGDTGRVVEADVGRQVAERHLGRAGEARGDDLVAVGGLQLDHRLPDVARTSGEDQARPVPSYAEQEVDRAGDAEGGDQLGQRRWGRGR